ncbi:small multidrug efflux protein [Georgenia sp. TF02-10]|uniref:small multidrug efflux protein n=1 Tax=Georgenia sp. TF02-10 TaxID=2917725 RepID=UPI001FA76FF8|nr:small multidrug efflux protein [Georgenia sp. TF02-10]UNX53817.1 small multidrug efflux protein [Georgenia sp. TF02-10]
MNPVENLVRNFQELVAQVPELVQPFVVMLAAAIPFIEGEGGAAIGLVGGINPLVAGIAAATGNFLCVLVVVLLSSGARTAVVNRRGTRVEAGDVAGAATGTLATEIATKPAKPESKGSVRFKRWLVRFGVPGASILGPLAIPTQFTSAMLVASGTPRGWVLLWQAVAIVLWTTVTTTLVRLALTAVLGA